MLCSNLHFMAIDLIDPHVIYLRILLKGFIHERLPNLKGKQWTRLDYISIEELFKKELKARINDDVEFAKIRELSVTTLERFFEKYDHSFDVSRSTLDKLSICLGFEGYQDYINKAAFEELADRAFVDIIIRGVLKEMFFAIKRLPYVYSFSTFFEPKLAFEIGSRILKTSDIGYYLVDGHFSGNENRIQYESSCSIHSKGITIMKPKELWIETSETWRLNWVKDFHVPENNEIVTETESGNVLYQIVQVDGLWRVFSIKYPENIFTILFK